MFSRDWLHIYVCICIYMYIHILSLAVNFTANLCKYYACRHNIYKLKSDANDCNP